MSNYPCPKTGCLSTDPDWCSECGAAMHPVPPVAIAKAPPASNNLLCPDCRTPREGSDEWCGVCRFNFTTGRSYGQSEPASPSSPIAEPPVSVAPLAQSVVPETSASKRPADVEMALTIGQPRGSWSVVIDFDPSLDPTLDAATMPPRSRLVFPLDLPELRIGRKGGRERPELPIDDEGVSSRHAKISFTIDGDPILLDLASTNGTCLNGSPIVAGVPVALTTGDRITLGRWTRMTIRSR